MDKGYNFCLLAIINNDWQITISDPTFAFIKEQ